MQPFRIACLPQLEVSKMATSSTPQKPSTWTFKRCGCPATNPHGYFHDGEDVRQSGPIGHIGWAFWMMSCAIHDGIIPREDRDALIEQIRAAGLSEE